MLISYSKQKIYNEDIKAVLNVIKKKILLKVKSPQYLRII